MKKIFGRHEHHDDDHISASLDYLMGPDFSGYLEARNHNRTLLEKIPFETKTLISEDGLQLQGYYYQQPDNPHRTAVLIHGHSSNAYEGYASVGLAYIKHGWNVLMVDNRACGKSAGKWCTFGLKERFDTLDWVKMLCEQDPGCQIIVHGTSLGGAAVCMMSELELPKQVKAVVSDCAFSNIRSQLAYMIKVTAHIPAWLILPEILLWFKHETGLDIDACSPLSAVSHTKVPMLFIQGEEDRYVRKQNGDALYQACTSQKKYLLMKGAGHAASYYTNHELYEKTLFPFLDSVSRGKSE